MEQTELDLARRVVLLEERVAFQEHALAELSDALAAARDDEARNALRLQRALDELRQMRLALSNQSPAADPASEPPPPHY